MHARRLAAALALVTLFPACATIIEGGGQNVTVETDPPGATCVLDRQDKRVGAVSPTPGTLRVDKSRNDIAVSCSKPGYTTTSVVQPSKFVGTTFGNLLLGGAVGFVVDASTGANFVYPDRIKLDLAPSTVPPTPTLGAPLAPSAPAS